MSSKCSWKTLARFSLCPVKDTVSSTGTTTQPLLRAHLTEAKNAQLTYLCLDIRHWQNGKPLGGISLSSGDLSFLQTSLEEKTTSHRYDNGKTVSLLMEPQPMILQVKAGKVNAVLLESAVMTHLQELLPLFSWMILTKSQDQDDVATDFVQALTAINIVDTYEPETADVEGEISDLIVSVKEKVELDMLKIRDFFGVSESAFSKLIESGWKSVDDDEVKEQVLDALKSNKKGTADYDYFFVKKFMESLDGERDEKKKKRKRI